MNPCSLRSPGRAPALARSMLCFVLITSACAIGFPALLLAQPDQAPFNERQAEATVVIENSNLYDGHFALSTLARVCGELPADMNFSGVPAYTVHFYPESGQGAIRDITFDSKELVGGVSTSLIFFLSVGVQSPAIGSPPAYVLDTSRPGTSGEARLTVSEDGTHELNVDGVNDMKEKIRLNLKCRPRA